MATATGKVRREESKPVEEKRHRDSLPAYEPPKIVTYSSDDLLELIGPAQACSPAPCGID